MHLVLPGDARERFVGQEVADVLGGERGRLVLVLLREGLVVDPEQVPLLPLEFRRGEAVALDARRLGDHGFQRAPDPVRLRHRREHGHFLRAHEDAPVHAGADKRRVRALAHLVEPGIEHGGVQVVDDALPVGDDGGLLANRELVEDRHRRRRQFRVGRHRKPRARVIRHRVGGTRFRSDWRGYPAEPLLDELLDRGRVEIADGDDRHQVGPVPVPVELLEPVVREGVERRLGADRAAHRVARSVQRDREQLVLEPGRRPAPLPPFLDDDAPLLVDLAPVEGEVVRPVLQDEEGLLQDFGAIGRHLQHERRVVERREGVEVRPELHADRLHEARDVLALEVLRAVEGHVLHHVRQPDLVVVFEHRPGVDHEAEFGSVRRPRVAADVVPQAVLQPADRDAGIDRHPLGRRRQRDDGHRRGLAGHGRLGLAGGG